MSATLNHRLSTCVGLLSVAMLCGCNDTRDLAPLDPATPWQTDRLSSEAPTQKQLTAPPPAVAGGRVFALPPTDAPLHPPQANVIDPAHAYSLSELIDIAQSRNQSTRVAWEQARQAAIQVGISRATLLPTLTVDALGGYTRTASPFPTALVPRGYITSDAEAVFPELVVKYLLLDFGGRRAAIEAARQLSFAGNVGFTAAHQKLIMDVARAYFMLDGLSAQVAAAQTALANACVVDAAAASRFARGEGTVTEVAIARRGVAQAQLAVPQAQTGRDTARLDLLALLDLPPQTGIKVEDSATRPLARDTSRTLDAMMEEALRQRPDMLAELARLRASEQGIALARSEALPTISVAANLQGNIGQISTNGGPYAGVKQPQAGVFLRFDWPLYTGGAKENAIRLAESRRAEAEASLRRTETDALRQIALAYDVLGTGLAQYDAAVALQTAAQTAFDAATSAYAHGVGTLTDAANAQTALAMARASVAQTHAQALVNAASLAFATGSLTSANDPVLTRAAP